MRVLSLFDGISCARVALERAGHTVESYHASEIEKNAIKVSTKNYPDIIQIGDVSTLFLDGARGFKIDLLIGGSPCQDLSIAKKDRKGLAGNRSGLFWEYVRLLRELKPTWFVLENVASMPKTDRDAITKEMGVEPVLFNASLVSAQSRKRLFWTNIPFQLPADKGILLKDILQPEVEEKYFLSKTMTANGKNTGKVGFVGDGEQYGQGGQAHRVYSPEGKTPTLSSGPALVKVGKIRKLTPVECERLQGLPDNYTEGIAMTNRYRCLGNAFHVDVVSCILRGIDQAERISSR